MVLILEASITLIVRNLAHALRVDAHRLMGLLCHSENLAHLRRSWGGLSFVLGRVNSVLVSELFEVRVFQSLGCTQTVVMVVYQQLCYYFNSLGILRHHLC